MATTTKPATAHLVQYIILRKDLLPKGKSNSWTWGAVIAQACHSATACLFTFRDDSYVQEYLKDLGSMHKVVLSVPDLPSLTDLYEQSREKGIDSFPWLEQPENTITALAFKPYPKELIHPLVSHLKLLR
jgi:peptidyl-tRNA hydrolase